MQTSQWLYTSPVYAEALHRSEDHLLAAAAGPVVAIVDPYVLERRAWFAPPQGFTDASVTPTEARPEDVKHSIRFSFETLKEFSMRDSGWTATVRSIAWSPRSSGFADGGCFLGVVQSDNKVLLYSMPSRRSNDRLECVADLTDSIRQYFKNQEEWKDTSDVAEGDSEEDMMRLRGGGRGRGKGRSVESRRHAKRIDDTPEEYIQIVQNFKFPRDADAILAASVEEGNDQRFRLDFPRVVLTLWLQLRSHFTDNNLPQYKKGEFLFGIDRHIYDRVTDHLFGLYGEAMLLYNITRKHIETRSRALIRTKAIMSFESPSQGRGTHPAKSALALIGQATNSETSTCHIKDMTIVSSDMAAVCIGDTTRAVRQVKGQSGKKRKSGGHNKARLISHYPESVRNVIYDWRLSVLNITCASWSPILWGKTTFLALGNKAGCIILWRLDTSGHGCVSKDVTNHCRLMGAQQISKHEICSIRWTNVALPDFLQSLVFVAVADVSGQVTLWTMDQECLMEETESLLHGGFLIHRSDLRPVSCLAMHTISSRRLQICTGKCGGAFSVWQSPDIAAFNAHTTSWLSEGNLLSRYNCHGSKVITGIVANMFNDWIVTVGLDGRICCWEINKNEIIEVQSHTLQSHVGSGFEAFYGVTSSPCGMLLAVIKDLGDKQIDAQEQRMVWKRVAHGSIELISLLNFDDGRTWTLVEGHIRNVLNQRIEPSYMRSFGNLMCIALMEDKGRNLFVEQLDENETDEDVTMDDLTSISVDIDAQRNKQSKAEDLLQFMLDTLAQQGHVTWHPAMSEVDLQHLRSAISLYYTVKDIPGIKLNQDPIRKAELTLLQHHAMTVLSYPKRLLPSSILDSIQPLQSMKKDLWTAILLTMAAWTVRFKHDVHPVLLKKAQQLIIDCPEVFTVIPNFTSDDPIQAATVFEKKDEDIVMKFDRCHITLLPMEELISASWKCDTCGRSCLTPQQWLLESKGVSNPDCLFCSTPLHQ